MNDVFSLAVFAAKVLCLMRVRNRPEARWQHRRRPGADEPRRTARRRPEMQACGADILPSGFASRRQALHCTSDRRALLKSQ